MWQTFLVFAGNINPPICTEWDEVNFSLSLFKSIPFSLKLFFTFSFPLVLLTSYLLPELLVSRVMSL